VAQKKTESYKIVLRYLTSRVSESNDLARKLLDQNPILEAFGNAKTLRNPNSSRFGKFMKLHFKNSADSLSFDIAGATIDETYLLEKSRVVFQPESERYFHVFYDLVKGERNFHSIKDFHYKNQSGQFEAEGREDAKEFQMLNGGLKSFGCTTEEFEGIYSVIAGLLCFGNIKFEDEDTAEGNVAVVTLFNLTGERV
jgi:myosin heavy subunit